MEIIKKKDLIGHDVYEICTAKDYPNLWNEDSLYITMEDFSLLLVYLDKVFPTYHYFGPQKITIEEWTSVKNDALSKVNPNNSLFAFFNEIDNWIECYNSNNDHFWINGI